MKGEDVEAWARSFGGTALLGLISALLLVGKLTHYVCQRRGLLCGLLVVPPVLISGVLGLLLLVTLDHVDPIMAEDVRVGLESLRRNLVSFVFAAFALGLMSTKSHSLHTSSLRGLVVSILHEGMPMMIYSQVLLWGQTVCCMLVYMVTRIVTGQVGVVLLSIIPCAVLFVSGVLITVHHTP
ncbi:hypothetical protein EON64_02875 [archaeon]|nr:MAG: hypothetical protein EON64_02875 [archaeon]